MRIAIATAVYYPMINGVAVFSHNLARGLVARGNEVLVLCPSQTGKSYTEEQDGVKVRYLSSIEFKAYPDQIHVAKKKGVIYEHGFRIAVRPGKGVAAALEDFQPEVVHVQVADLIGLAAARWAHENEIPLIMTEHNQPEVLLEPLGMPKILEKPTEKVLSAFFARRLNRGDFATMPTQEAIENLIFAQGKEFKVPVAAVSNGVELSNFKPGRAERQIYEKYGLKRDAPTALYVGRVDPEKKVGTILGAFKLAREEVPEAQLVIVGDGVARRELERTAEREFGEAEGKSQNSVHFLGRVVPPDLYELYRVGEVFATASEIETQGIVLIEAAATGLPLIAVDKGAVSEVCQNGKNGILCRPGNTEEIAAAMVEILTDKNLRKKMSEKSLEIAHQHDFERTLDQFLNIYRKVIELKKV